MFALALETVLATPVGAAIARCEVVSDSSDSSDSRGISAAVVSPQTVSNLLDSTVLVRLQPSILVLVRADLPGIVPSRKAAATIWVVLPMPYGRRTSRLLL